MLGKFEYRYWPIASAGNSLTHSSRPLDDKRMGAISIYLSNAFLKFKNRKAILN
jgi:hypothetical protein